ncbi:MAG: hypothetical protein IT292_02125 [Deltaproteobacteria bacterium]|nr:hypothetical protein [Deltaproteobacteria bacterium]
MPYVAGTNGAESQLIKVENGVETVIGSSSLQSIGYQGWAAGWKRYRFDVALSGGKATFKITKNTTNSAYFVDCNAKVVNGSFGLQHSGATSQDYLINMDNVILSINDTNSSSLTNILPTANCPSAGFTYYVSKASSCADTNPGTLSRPWCSLTMAGQVAHAGDTVYVGPGVYREILRQLTRGLHQLRLNLLGRLMPLLIDLIYYPD